MSNILNQQLQNHIKWNFYDMNTEWSKKYI